MRFSFIFTWLVFVLFAATSVHSSFYFAGKDSRLRITNPRARVVLRKPLLNFQGTLETTDSVASLLLGEPIVFSSGTVERNGSSVMWTGSFDASKNGMMALTGSSQMRAQPGMVFAGLHVTGVDNLVEGTPKFSEPIELADQSSELKFSIQNKLGHDVYLNNGKITLEDTLSIGDDVLFLGNGVVNINQHTLNFPGKPSVWGGSLYFLSATDMTLNAHLTLTGEWFFGPNNSVAVLQGNGNVLDLSSGGSLVVQSGVGLGVTDVVIKGLSETQGTICMWDSNSTLSLSNAVLQLSGNYSFTQGRLYFYGANSMIVTGTNVLNIGNAVATIDATTLEYDPLSLPDVHPIIPYIPDGVNLISVNNGRLICRPGSPSSGGLSYGSTLYIDMAFYQQNQHESFNGAHRVLNFRGANASNITWDGGGHSMLFSRGTSLAGSLVVGAGKTVTLQNVVLKDFSSSAVTLGAGASLVFGNGVTIELGSNESLTMTWSFTGQVTASTIRGNGKCLNLDALTGGNKVAIAVGPGEGALSPVTLNIEDVHLSGLKGGVNYDSSMTVAPEYTYSTVDAYIASGNLLRCVDYTGVINFRNVDLNLGANYTLTAGNINIYNDVELRGKGYQFAFASNGTFAINSGATFLVDRNVTFSYDSSGLGERGGPASKDQITMADQTSRLFLNGCTFYGTMTAPRLQTGVFVVNDRVVIHSEGDIDANAITLDSTNNLRIEVLAGATMDVYGALAYQ